MICSNCGTENRPGRKFCAECASPLAVVCPACGASNEPGEKFCGECATPLTDTAVSPGPASRPVVAAPVAERRHVTVLFADIVGFTPFAEERDAEEVRDTLSRYFELCADVIGRYGGTVEKYIGDAVMALWGAPTAHEDDAERAVRAALELVDVVTGLTPTAQARVGVLTGEAAVTLGATIQGIVAGDLVNTAARLQSVAEPGTVLVGEATFRAAADAIAFEDAGEQVLKGKQSPVPAWRALRVVAQRGGRNRSEALEAPFVGRADELRLLKELFHATGREHKVRLVSVMGQAGIGKSRLTWEFLKYVDGLVETTYWHSGRSPSYGEGITFWALGEMVRSRCGLVESDEDETTRQKVSETVAQWVPDESERAWIEPALLTLLGIGSGMSSDQLFGAWRTFFERIATSGTVVLVFEDMNFADSGLLDFIDHMLDWSRGYPIDIVTLARPELLDKRPDWGAGKRSFTSIFLEPLSEPDMRQLLSGLAPGLPDGTVSAIIERADGVPLYAVETVRMLVADGRLVERDGAYVPMGDLTSLPVPETLTALISSRLDALDATDRSIIHDAAVLGQSFTVAGLAAVSGIPETDLGPRLAGLMKHELLTRTADPRSPEQGKYAFVQSLIREVAYSTLSKKDRKVRHLAAARYFEQLGSDELASALAGHYLAAHNNAPQGAEADALAAQACIAFRAAAERAVALGAHDQVVAFLDQALSLTNDPADQADILERAAKSARISTKYDAGIDRAHRAAELRTGLGERLGAASALGLQGMLLHNATRDNEARTILEHTLEQYVDLWPDAVIAELKVTLASVLFAFDENALAIRLCDDALEVAEHDDNRQLLARALIAKGAALGFIGRLREAISLIGTGEELARASDDSELILEALWSRGIHLSYVDNVASMRCFRDGLALSRRVGHRQQEHIFIVCFGSAGFVTGAWDDALTEMDGALAEDLDQPTRAWILNNELIIRVSRGESIADGIVELDRLASMDLGAPLLALTPLDPKANAAQAEGRFDDAQRDWLTLAEKFPGQLPDGYYQAARPALWAGDADALRRYRDNVDATGFHGPVVEARRLTLKSGLAALEGREGEALAGYLEALAAWRDLRITWDEALTGLDMVTVLDPELPEVRAVAKSTREILERLGARPYLELLDAAMARRTAAPAFTTTQPAAVGAHG